MIETKLNIDALPDEFVDSLAYKEDINNINNIVADKQEILVDGVNIKTVNGENILGEGNIDIPVYDDTNLVNSINAISTQLDSTKTEINETLSALDENKADKSDVAEMIGASEETLETLQTITEYVVNNGSEAASLIENVQNNANNIADEIQRATSVDEELEKKINSEIDALKEGNTIVGQAREIHSRNGKTVEASFLTRTTAGSGTIGDGVATLKSVGGNIVKNMLGNFNSIVTYVKYDTQFKNDSVIINAKEEYIGDTAGSSHIGVSTLNFITGHEYYISANCYSEVDREVYVCLAVNGFKSTTKFADIRANEWKYVSKILTVTGDDLTPHISIYPFGISGSIFIQEGALVLYGGINIIDLTEMFGAGKELSQADCDKLFTTMAPLPKGLTIANPTEFKSTGFNQFNPDNVLEGKTIVDNTIIIGYKKIAVIPCLPCKVGVGENNGYCIHGDFGEDIKVYLTPFNPMEVEGELYMHELTKNSTTDTYVPLIKGYMLVEVPTTANLCAHFLWSEDRCERDSYEPYFESKIELPSITEMSEWGLAGIQSRGTLVCDEIDFENGVYRKKIYAQDLSIGGWVNKRENFNYFIFPTKSPTFSNNIICERYSSMKGDIDSLLDKHILLFDKSYICVRDDAYTTIEEFKASLNGMLVYYDMATSEEYSLPKVDNNYTSSDYGVEQFDSVIPCNANNLYYMRSLAGETRNFLDRLYSNTAKTDAKGLADYITNGIEENKELATNVVLELTTNINNANFAIYTNALNSQSGGNIFDKNAVGILVNKIIIDKEGNITDREKYNISDYMAVVPGETYIISNVGLKPHAYSINKEHIATVEATDGVFTVPEGAYWIRISYYQTWADEYCINKGTTILPKNQRTYGLVRTEKLYDAAITTDKIADNTVTIDKLNEELKEKVLSLPTVVKKNGAFVAEGTLSSGEKFELPQNSISVGEYITFSANINGEFGALYIGHGRTNGAYMKITPTTVTTYSHVTNPVSEKEFEHGLTIENNIQVYIEKSKNSTTTLKIASNGKNYEFFFSSWYGNKGTPFVESEGCELKDCSFGWTCKAINSDIWAFGDSYFGVTGTIRWMAYMIAAGHTNLVVNGFGGQGSVSAFTDLTGLFTIGTPKKILWCLGMNDADSSTAVNTNWLNTYNSLKALCENNNIELILATIPTVPSRIHKFKNEIIRSSGYRYIDFDKAVGADESTGAWFGDMLSSDGVHPSETGALTLYNRAIADMPELLNC